MCNAWGERFEYGEQSQRVRSGVSDYAPELQIEKTDRLDTSAGREATRVAPEQKDRDTFGGAGAPCLVSRSDVFFSLMQGCHRGSDPETGGSGSHGAVHSTPPGRSKPVQKNRKEASRGQASSEAVRLALKISVYQTHLPPAS